MHELSLVNDLVQRCCTIAEGRAVEEVRARCSSGIDIEEVKEGFDFLTSGGSLAGARLALEAVPASLDCACGFLGPLGPDDIAGHICVCPRCGEVKELGRGLELVSVTLAALPDQ